MTSSLVGSEMCIRDSPCRVELLLGDDQQDQDFIGLEEETPLSALQSTQTVSYTHLTMPTICSV
eukprot:10489549-Prorocentrum_lima.AAC.1